MKPTLSMLIGCLALTCATSAMAITKPKPATSYTIATNKKVYQNLPFSNKQDFVNAQRGFIAKDNTLTIRATDGSVIWDMEKYKSFISLDTKSPDTVNPSLWRNAQLGMQYGLFSVTKNIYQVRSYDLSNITFVKGKTGWIVFDPLISPETAKAAFDLVTRELGKRPIVAVIYSHSHIDHYGGAKGIISQKDVDSGKVQVIAPEYFAQHVISENVIAGNAMGRRAVFMYGALLPRNAKGQVSSGLGMTVSTGKAGLILPSKVIKKTGEILVIDGVKMVFQMTPGTEAPAEMNTWFPEWNALWMAENASNTMHNILTLRGAVVRDALKWAKDLNETIDIWGDKVEVKFQGHHWPLWGNKRIVAYLEKQRDIYKFMHDQTVRLMNKGYNGEEISEMIKLPMSLENNWATRGYYGTLRHNTRAIYQFYMGWYNGNPSDLNNLPAEMVAKKYVEFMGGEKNVIKQAQKSFNKGEYRWVAEVMKHAVFAEPDNKQAKELLADAYEQMGYQAESGPWRSEYLQGAYELRNGTPQMRGLGTATPDTIRAMTADMLFDFWGVHLNAQKAESKVFNINFNFTDINKHYTLKLKNSVLNYTQKQIDNADLNLSLSIKTMQNIQMGTLNFKDEIEKGNIKTKGDTKVLVDLLHMLDQDTFWFNIVTP